MEVELRAGAKIDLASPAELAEQTDRIVAKLDELDDWRETIVIAQAVVTADAAGLVGGGALGNGVPLYEVPQDAEALINRIAMATVSSTPAAPTAAGWLQTFRNRPDPSNLCHQTPQPGSANTLPVIITDGSGTAVRLRHGDVLVVAGAGFAAGLVIGVSLQVRLLD